VIDFEEGCFQVPLHNLPGGGRAGKMPGTLPGVDLGDLPQVFHFESHMRTGASFHSHTFFRLKFDVDQDLVSD